MELVILKQTRIGCAIIGPYMDENETASNR